MKLFFLTMLLANTAFLLAEDVVVGDTLNYHDRERFVWRVSQERLRKLPIWQTGAKVPLDINEAVKAAKSWISRQTSTGYLPEQPNAVILMQLPQPHQEHYIYKVYFGSGGPGIDWFWTVHVLMDGTTVEPVDILLQIDAKKTDKKETQSSPSLPDKDGQSSKLEKKSGKEGRQSQR